jgi:hypothetical protein
MMLTACYARRIFRSVRLSRRRTLCSRNLNAVQQMQMVIKELYDQELLTVNTLAAVFHVSYDAMVFRLHTLGYIRDGQRDKLREPGERQNDKLQSLADQSSKRVAHLRMRAVISVFTSVDGFSYCQKCSSLILDDRWSVCHSCGSDIV